MSFNREQIKEVAARLASEGIYIGSSSWKYPGWRGQLYDDARYVYRGRFAEKRFERHCLIEYAEVFKTVGVDAAYYQFPTQPYLEELFGQVPSDFQFAFKVTDSITVKRYPKLPRFGPKAGEANEHFLDFDLFASDFLTPCAPFRAKIGLLMFEFSRFHSRDYKRGRDFAADLDQFLGRLPKDWAYGVEVRNPAFLNPEYFTILAQHGVAHIFNSWQAMPSIQEQLALPGSITRPDLVSGRLLLRPGRAYADAVKLFSPYDRVQDPYPEGRTAGAQLIQSARQRGGRAFVFVNNRFEGNALETISGILEQANGGK